MILFSAMKICQTRTFLLKTDRQRKFVKERYKTSSHTFHLLGFFCCWNSKSIHRCTVYILYNAVTCKKCIYCCITPHKMTQFLNNYQILSTNLLLTEHEGRTGDYCPEVVAVPVRRQLARLVKSVFYGTRWPETFCRANYPERSQLPDDFLTICM